MCIIVTCTIVTPDENGGFDSTLSGVSANLSTMCEGQGRTYLS